MDAETKKQQNGIRITNLINNILAQHCFNFRPFDNNYRKYGRYLKC